WVVAGSIARQWLGHLGIAIRAEFIETNNVAETAASGDSTGGIVRCTVTGVASPVGEPVHDKLHSRLAAAMMSINAAKGFEYGDGCRSAYMTGTESMDLFAPAEGGATQIMSNHSGGIQGGIANGMPIEFTVYFKPTPTVMRPVETVDTAGNRCVIDPKGRHDPCVAIRAVPVVESMAALVLADMVRLDNSLSTLMRQ
ncbi:MAG: chorismate synthase, partial [Muribaculaceae bacterium]|nr:chorismate synthase [Muribaculaceae bacterium]